MSIDGRPLCNVAAFVVAGLVSGCVAPERGSGLEHVGDVSEALMAQCQANVKGHGLVDVETTYLPDVVHCENGGAPLESLKAQAIAARTYLYYKLETSGSIGDGQGDQAFTCGSHATALEKQAVAETAGQVMRYGNTIIAAFFVAGGTATPPECHDSASSTSLDVTYNAGLTGAAVHQTHLGLVSPSNSANRGCLSQLGSRCLANAGKNAEAILKFYYGDDIAITQATGPCVPTTGAPDAGSMSDAGPSADAPTDAAPDGGDAPRDLAAGGAGDPGGCALARPVGASGRGLAWIVAALGLSLVRRKRPGSAAEALVTGRRDGDAGG